MDARSSVRAGTPEADAREQVLVRAIQRGEGASPASGARPGTAAAWAELLARYQDRLFGVCFRMVGDREKAADLTQDAMVKIIEGLDSYDGRAKLSTWMIRVTMNVCLSRLRSDRLRRHASLEAMAEGRREDRFPDLGAREQSGPAGVERNEARRIVAEALLRIAPDQRAILVLRDSRGLDYDQIAEVLEVPVGTVKSRLFRARTALREAIEELEPSAKDWGHPGDSRDDR
ncbi:MAG: sigma-70 family RNA polymerase sigma factor [Phycisphaerae bacterium]|nr:sigma-70 family RNA polymerase sigma factor [Phycisphaerae bacterium]